MSHLDLEAVLDGVLAESAAVAIENARLLQASEQRLRDAMGAAEVHRRRWARELHDETLQGLGALRMLLVGARRSADPGRLRQAVEDAVANLDGEIESLRCLIRDLRPAALDELGAAAA